MRKSSAIPFGILVIVATSAALTVPALADVTPVPISATVTVPSVLTLTGTSPTVNFGTINAGSSGTVTAAEVYQVGGNTASTVSLTPVNGGFHTAIGQPDKFGDQQLSVNGATFPGPAAQPSPLDVHDVGSAGGSFSDDWTLAVPNGIQAANLNAQFSLSVVATG
jgi:hypothetical protein